MKYLKIFLFSFLIILFSSCNSVNDFKISNEEKKYEIYKINCEFQKKFHGYIKAQYSTDLSFLSEGKIIYLPYTIGDFVKKGQVLAKLDGILYKIQKQEEMAKLNEAQIRQNRFNTYYKRIDVLHKAGAVSDNDWEEAEFNLNTAKQEVLIQKEKISYIDTQLSYNQILAPFDGYIYDKKQEIGSYAIFGKPVLSIINSNLTQIDVVVDSSIINLLTLNQKVKIERLNKIYIGKIAHISNSSLKDGGYLIKILLEKLYPDLKEGMSVDVIFDVKSETVFVPLNFILFDEKNNQKFVYKINRLDENEVLIVKKYLKTKNSSLNLIEIESDLKSGDEIIIFKNSKKDLNGERIRL